MRRTPVPHRFDVALALRRRPRHRRALVIGLAVLCGLAVMTVVQRAEDAAAAWGARGPRAGGHARPRRRVTASTPATPASTTTPRPWCPTARSRALPDGSAGWPNPCTRARWCDRSGSRPAGLSEVAARLPAGHARDGDPRRAGQVPPLVIGDRVDVLVALPPEAAGGGPPGLRARHRGARGRRRATRP